MPVKSVDMGSWLSKKIQSAKNTGRRAGISTFKKWFTKIRPGQLANKKEFIPVRSSRRAK
jgi:hypothetical protein